MTSRTRTTVLEGYYATGDWESFCFDKHDGPESHSEWRKTSGEWRKTSELDEDLENSCRVYPDDLLPNTEGTLRKGRWTITITFVPEEELCSPLLPGLVR